MRKAIVIIVLIGLVVAGAFVWLNNNRYTEKGYNPYDNTFRKGFKFDRDKIGISEIPHVIPDMTSPGSPEIEIFGVNPTGESILEGLDSLDLKVACYSRGEYTYSAHYQFRNLLSGTPDMRVTYNNPREVYITNYKTRQILESKGGAFQSCVDYDVTFEELYRADLNMINQTMEEIKYWDGEGEIVVYYGNDSRAHYYDIVLNPDLPDDLFMP